MSFSMPVYHHPDFTCPELTAAPSVRTAKVIQDGVAPEGYHSTSMVPEYFKIQGRWILTVSWTSLKTAI